ncbi:MULTISPECIES: ribonuclease P protein component [unclassified Agarivorans]|uniref:ribonuclease P protein component n=2 Tax=unclassified Agarivorans TaxID=2636026 RepID=UPI0010F969C9|nr:MULTISPECIES: ribonuclease P protein component [unclassified Agarivorans]MDO6687897.1 ribonuclease P protein component [Agarivorans sp. 3_MG-2023]MDO6717540.1 ribonuclease P protein component [Agarivorans sp. 2_MG-2023]MDO6764207.1 ribonuclease P protein component [Agarivorans sp. 1_MG-2023]
MQRQTFGRELRLLTPMHFKHVFSNPVRVGTPQLTILAKTNTLSHPRLGLAVSKKSIKLAVGRNRIKRLARESFRLHQHQLPAVDIVVISKNGISDLSNQELMKLLEKSWRRLTRRCE